MISDEEPKESQEGSSRGIASQESCEWDSFQDTSSYFCDSLDSTIACQTYRLNSSTDNLLLDHWLQEYADSEETENISRW